MDAQETPKEVDANKIYYQDNRIKVYRKFLQIDSDYYSTSHLTSVIFEDELTTIPPTLMLNLIIFGGIGALIGLFVTIVLNSFIWLVIATAAIGLMVGYFISRRKPIELYDADVKLAWSSGEKYSVKVSTEEEGRSMQRAIARAMNDNQ